MSGPFEPGTEVGADELARIRQEVAEQQAERERGVYKKYDVRRVNDPSGKHDDCWYFVLDPRHDTHARTALAAYAESVKAEFPNLYDDLRRVLDNGGLPS